MLTQSSLLKTALHEVMLPPDHSQLSYCSRFTFRPNKSGQAIVYGGFKHITHLITNSLRAKARHDYMAIHIVIISNLTFNIRFRLKHFRMLFLTISYIHRRGDIPPPCSVSLFSDTLLCCL